jgi:hypothetical protein
MSNNLRDEKLSPGNTDPAGASEPNPDPNAHLDASIPGDEPEETTVKGRMESFGPVPPPSGIRRNRNEATFAVRLFWWPRR